MKFISRIQLKEAIKEAISDSLEQGSSLIFEESQRRVPKKSANLKSTGYFKKLPFDRIEFGYSADYAEDVNKRTHFMDDSINNNMDSFLDTISSNISERLMGGKE